MLKFVLLMALCIFSIYGTVGQAAANDCNRPTLFESSNQRSVEGINSYLNEWFHYENCMIENLTKTETFVEFRFLLNQINQCAPDYEIAFNEWDTNLISERAYYSTMAYCNQFNLARLDLLLNAVWTHIKNISGGIVSENLLFEQRAWLNFYNLACYNSDDHPAAEYQSSSCKVRELTFRVLSLSQYIGEGGDYGWPANSIDELLSGDFRIQKY